MVESTQKADAPRICVVGVGGGGCSAVDRMAEGWADGPSLAAINTNAHTLSALKVPTKLQIGLQVTRGLSSGGDPQTGRLAAEADYESLRGFFSGTGLVFLVATLGGGTGSGAAPVVARAAREQGAMVLCFGTLPFDFEGETRRGQAARALGALRDEADAVIVVPNQRLFELVRDGAGAEAAFRQADEVLGGGIQSIWNLVTRPGLINLDFADLRHVVQNSGGTCVFGYGEGTGEGKALTAATAVLNSPLLDHGRIVAAAQALLVSIVGGPDLALGEIESVMKSVSSAAPKEAEVFMGAAVRPDWTGRVSVTIVAAEQWSRPKETTGASPSGDSAPARADDPTGFKRKRRGKATQTSLTLEPVGKGRFKDVEPTILDGEDLDIPAFMRRGLVIDRG